MLASPSFLYAGAPMAATRSASFAAPHQTLTHQTSVPASMARITSFAPSEDESPAYLVLKPDLRTVVSPFRRVLIPECPLSEFFLELIDVYRDRIAIVDASTGHQIKYSQLDTGIRKVASALFAHGLRQGDVVAIMAPNIPEYAVVFHAISLYGGVVTPVDPDSSDDEIQSQLHDLQVRYFFTMPAYASRVSNIWTRLGSGPMNFARDQKNIFVFGRPAKDAQHTPFAELMRYDSLFPDHIVDPHQQVAAVFYTRDETNRPRGLEFSHYNLTAALVQALAYDDIATQDHLLATMPFHTPFGFNIQLNVALARGVTVVVQSAPSTASFASLLSQYQISRIYTSSAATVRDIASLPSAGYLKGVVFGGSDIAPSDLQALEGRHGVNIRQLFGINEAIVTHAILKGTTVDAIAGSGAPKGSIGQLLPNVEAVIVEKRTGLPCPATQIGDLLVRAPQCFSGYVNPERSPPMDPEGWIRTGLTGFYDKKGFFFVHKH